MIITKRSLSQANMLVCEHHRDQTDCLRDLHCHWSSRLSMYIITIELLLSYHHNIHCSRPQSFTIYIANEHWLFVHSNAIKHLCLGNILAVETTCSWASSQPTHSNMIIIRFGWRRSLQGPLWDKGPDRKQSVLWFIVHSHAPNMQPFEYNSHVSRVLGWLVALMGRWRETTF
jgi:hypothetical protein